MGTFFEFFFWACIAFWVTVGMPSGLEYVDSVYSFQARNLSVGFSLLIATFAIWRSGSIPATPTLHPGGHAGKRILIFLGFYFSASLVAEQFVGKSPTADQTIGRATIVAVSTVVMWWFTYRLSKSWVVEDASAKVTAMATAIADENKRIAVEKKRAATQNRHKPTSKIIQWGLFQCAASNDAVLDDGRVILEGRYECPRCHSWTTWQDAYAEISNVEKLLKPSHPDWLLCTQNLTPYNSRGETMSMEEDLSRAQFYPSELQDFLGTCSPGLAKRYIAASSKLGLVGRRGLGWPTCDSCSSTKVVSRRPMSPRLRREIFMRDGHKCVECGANRTDDPEVILHVDHIIPVAAGGKDHADNLQTLCIDCNLGKSDDRSYM